MNKLKHILLVYPEVPKNTYWGFKYALNFIGKKSAMPPLGLITVASFFPESYRLKLVDLNIEPLTDDHLRWADAVFVSAMLVQKDSFQQIVKRCNRLKIPVVAGGPYPTSCYSEISGVDHFVLGEVENSFKDFLSDLENGSAKKLYPPPQKPDISRTAVPRFDLLDLKSYSSMSIQYSRGCPFKCEFCDIWKAYGNKPRLKSADAIITELETLRSLGWCGPVFIVDDNFIGNKRRVKEELLPALTGWQKKNRHLYRFFTEASINIADDKALLAAMRDAGFNEVFIGIETPSHKSLKETGKVQNLKSDLQKAIRTIQNFGIEVMAGFILGFDSDTEDIFDQQISFIQRTGIPKAMVGLLTAIPGTDLFGRLQKEGRILHEFTGNNTHTLVTNFITKMDTGKLKDGYQKVLSFLYDRNLKNYFARCSKLLDNLGRTDYFQRNIHWDDLQIFFKSIFRQLPTPYGFQYLKFVMRNLIKHRSIFAESIKFGIMGHHFYMITRQMLKVEKISSYLDDRYSYLRRQVNLYSSLVGQNSKEALQNIMDLWNQAKEILEEAKTKLEEIPADFRGEISRKYAEVAQRTKELFKTFEDDLIQSGTRVERQSIP